MARFIVATPQSGTGLDADSRLLLDTDSVPSKVLAVYTSSNTYPTVYDVATALNAAEEE